MSFFDRSSLAIHSATTVLAAIAVVVIPVPLEAQNSTDRIPTGSRVRIEGPGLATLTGSLNFLDADRFRLVPDGGSDPVTVPGWRVERVSVYRGTRSGTGRGALIGGGIGAAISLVGIVTSQSEDSWFDPGPGAYLLGAGIITGAFAGIGALIGSASEHDVWEKVPNERLPWRVGVAPALGGGVAVGARLSI